MKEQILKDGWKLSAYSIEKNPFVKNDDIFDFQIPGEIHSSLFKANRIPDPRLGENITKLDWIKTSKWIFASNFAFEREEGCRTYLYLSRVKGITSININCNDVGITDNEYKLNYFDITDIVDDGDNEISIEIEALDRDDKLQSIGIYEDIKIIQTRSFLVQDYSFTPVKKAGKWEIEARILIESFSENDINLELKVAGKERLTNLHLKNGIGLYKESISIDDDSVELWWPNGYGKPHIYPMTMILGEFRTEKFVAFRTVEMRKDKNLELIINGKSIFMKGANYSGHRAFTADVFTTLDRRILESAASANMNMLKLGSDVGYENDAFYNECDRLGLAIWQALPDKLEEEEYMLLSIKSHPSIVLWSVAGENAEILARRERELDPSRPVYIEKDSDKCWPRWSDGENFESFHKKNVDFISEFGIPSYPYDKTLEMISDSEDLNLTSRNMNIHERNERDVETIVSLLARNTQIPLNVGKIRYLSQAIQSCAMSSAIMGWRALMPYTMGTLFSSLNDTWPEISNSTIDYNGKWKVAHYASRRFYASLAPLIFLENDKLMVYVANDSAKDEEVELKLKLRHFNGKKKESHVYNVVVPSMTSVKVREVDLKKIDRRSLFAYVKMQNKSIIRERTILLTDAKDAMLEDPTIKAEITQLGTRKAEIRLSSSKPAFWVSLDSGSVEGTFSDNFIAVRQTADKTIIFDSTEELDVEKLKNELSIMDLYSAMH